MKPLISIIIPVYNGDNYLRQAIDSALKQTYDNYEIIVINDGSTDNGATEKIALEYGDAIRYYYKENGGVSSALNYGIKKMKGDYFSWLSHDDMYTKDKLSLQVKMIPKDWENTLLLCGTVNIDKNSNPITHSLFLKKKSFPKKRMSNVEMLHEIFKGKTISGCALLVPKKAFETTGVFNEEFMFMQDMDLWYRMLVNGINVIYTDKVGVLSRIHSNQFTVKGKAVGKKDATKVGMFMVDELKTLKYNSKSLLKEYMFLCFRNESNEVGKKAYDVLNKENKLSIIDKLVSRTIMLYGKVRPLLIRVFYAVKYGIKVKK